jgi:hypothetical protein
MCGVVRGRKRLASIFVALVAATFVVWPSAIASATSAGVAADADGGLKPLLVLAQSDANRPDAAAPGNRVTNPPPSARDVSSPADGRSDDTPKAYVTFKTPYEFFLCMTTVALGVGMLLVLVIMCWRTGPSEDFIRAFIVISVIFSALFLIVAGYNEKQTAPVFGLLGTILGYVFGKVARPIAQGEGAPVKKEP